MFSKCPNIATPFTVENNINNIVDLNITFTC